MLSLVEVLWQGVVNLVHSLHPRQVRRYVRVTPIYLPLAGRSLRRRLLRQVLVGLTLAAGIAVFLVLSASTHGLAVDVSSRTQEMDLPADVLVLGARPAAGHGLADLDWTASVERYESFRRWEAETALGKRWVLGLPAGSEMWPSPVEGELPGPGEVLVPLQLAAGSTPVRVGDTVDVGRHTPHGYAGRGYTVSGFFEGADDLCRDTLILPVETLDSLLATLGATAGDDAGGATAVALWARAGDGPAKVAASVSDLFPGATFWREDSAADRAYRAVGGFLSPNRILLIVVFLLAGLGVFNVMLLTLLQRKTQLGVLKALGADDDEVFFLLLLEGGLVAAGGTLVGLTAGSVLVETLNRSSDTILSLAPSSIGLALVLAVASFYLASWLPATLCRRATPIQLMAGRRLYLDPRSTCAQCGRCGGF